MRNGKRWKTPKEKFSEAPTEIPRDRHGSFGRQLIPTHQTHRIDLDDKPPNFQSQPWGYLIK
jgi:putative transposase